MRTIRNAQMFGASTQQEQAQARAKYVFEQYLRDTSDAYNLVETFKKHRQRVLLVQQAFRRRKQTDISEMNYFERMVTNTFKQQMEADTKKTKGKKKTKSTSAQKKLGNQDINLTKLSLMIFRMTNVRHSLV